MKTITFFIFLLMFSVASFSQEYYTHYALIRTTQGDTLYVMSLPTVNIYGKIIFKTKGESRRFDKLARNVKKVYPYAVLAREKLAEYSSLLADVTSDKERRALMRQAEKELQDQYGEELKELTFTQGMILIKLVDRETGDTSYELVEELRGKFVAFFWQSLARIFGYNLKTKYDPSGEDKDIETIVLMIQNGTI
ncbi:MAG: DUF4294 domain-containing protein [Bacteroidetes bacterium]|nr:DUF4294 domain-containing protein [Bacteroidota bacterium]